MLVPPALPPFHPARPTLVAPVRRDLTGRTGPTPKQARGRHWRRTSQGWHVPAYADDSVVEQRIVEAAVVLPAFGAVTGWAALRWRGGYWFGGTTADGSALPVPLVTMGQDIRRRAVIHHSEERVDPQQIEVVDGLRVTTALHAASYEARYAKDLASAVVVLDMAAYSDLLSADELVLGHRHYSGWTGAPQLRKAMALMNENSWSPQESRLRVLWEVDAELPPPLCNTPLFDRDGRLIATPDLVDVEAGLACEYDSELHLTGAGRRSDRDRDEAYRRAGLEVVNVLSGDLAQRERVVHRLHEARRRCRFADPGERGWTVVPPPWWVPTDTVERRRALAGPLRARLLRHRLVVA